MVLASLLFVGCSLEKSEGESAVQQPVELVIRASQGGATRAMENVDDVIEVGAELAPAADNSTRTELGPATDTEQPIFWSCYYDEKEKKEVADQIMVWAEPAINPQGWAFAQMVFSLAHFNHDYHSADFTATVANTMDEDYDYTYYAIYPSPKSRNKQGVESAVSGITLNGTEVTYTLSANQSGEYNPAYDIMWGKVSGAALVERDGSGSIEVWRQPELRMKHLLHMMRIRVPEGRNLLGRDVKRLEITFPQAVVGGTAKVNVKTGEVVWSGQSNKVTIDLPDENLLNANGRYVWVQIKPEVLNGEISFQAYDDYGVPTQALSTTIDKTLSAGHITPVNLTIPTSKYDNVTYIEIEETANNLGEAWNTMTLSGYTFVKPFTLETTDKNVVTPNDAKKYKVAIVAAASAIQGKQLGLKYESEHTLFDDPITLPASISGTQVNVDKVVPYLLEEDFSGITKAFEHNTRHTGSDAGESSAVSLAQYGLNDWYGARVGGDIGKNICIASRVEMGMWQVNRNSGRVDTPKLNRLKSGTNATIKVEYNYAGDRYERVGSGGYPVYSAGTSTSVVNKGDNAIGNVVVNGVVLAIDGPGNNSTYYGNTPHYNSFNASGCNSSTRVSWSLTNNRAAAFAGNGMYYLYIDNIRVSIAN